MLLKKLAQSCGVSGNEKEVRDLILQEVKPYVDKIVIDPIGNLIVTKKGRNNLPSIMVSAHMDEVGLMVKAIDDKGFVKFLPVGGIDDRILVSKVVQIGTEKIKGVIGAKAIHLQKPDERKKALKHDQLYIDIGAKSKEEAEKLVSIGDYISFCSDYIEFGENLIKAKALDDRVGCAMLINLLKNNYDCTIHALFAVQEEVGLRGAKVAAYRLNPALSIVLEATTCHDLTDVDAPHFSTKLGEGPALSIADMGTYYNKNLVKKVIEIAQNNNISIQLKQTIKGGNDAGVIHTSREGIPTVALSVPCRYIHSPICVINKNDYKNMLNLVDLLLKNLKKEEII
ncbi:M42 family metallopeptidase [Anaerophilus nitritogenes]|uniref:M42 family metallopeptidase n=1 Tax=Anaerophilus nitritogenes TaxID=2498136 RepID=UPI00101D1664|nr:M42 family metallopeptidase [Anaerophilus nitritogenes]